jgi:hypothetical protein
VPAFKWPGFGATSLARGGRDWLIRTSFPLFSKYGLGFENEWVGLPVEGRHERMNVQTLAECGLDQVDAGNKDEDLCRKFILTKNGDVEETFSQTFMEIFLS